MSVFLLIIVLLVLAIAGYMIGRSRALASAGGNPRNLHSLPSYYGWHGAILTFLPALAFLTLWVIVQPLYIERQLSGFFPSEQFENDAQRTLLLADVRRVAQGLDSAVAQGALTEEEARMIRTESGSVRDRLAGVGVALGAEVTPQVLQAAQEYRVIASMGGLWRGILTLAIALASFGYLFSLEPLGSAVLVGFVLLFFFGAPQAIADGRRSLAILFGLIGIILAYLIWHKYVPVMVGYWQGASTGLQIAAPLGISYFTFKLIHYALEVARGNIKDRSLPRFFCYIFLFPIFTAGPIERFDHFIANTEDSWQRQSAVEGLTRIIHGLIKAFIVAQLLQPANFGAPGSAEQLLGRLDDIATYKIWIFLAVTYLFAYVDFSAYSDIAIGAARLFGFRIMENFNWPVIAVNITDFWRRWHMTLAAFCQHYVYVPVLAWSRTPYAAAFATFFTMGLWHGASAGWVMWGIYHAMGVAGYMAWARHMRRHKWWRDAIKSRLRWLGLPLTCGGASSAWVLPRFRSRGRR